MTIEKYREFISLSHRFYLQNGIWYSFDSPEISYPEDVHNKYYEIEESSYWFNHRNHCIILAIKKYFKGDCFFDVGAGNGFVAKAIKDISIPVVLIEPGKDAVMNAKSRKLENILCGTLNDLKELVGQLPSIGAFDIIEHIENDDIFIKEIYQMLTPGGSFFVTVPAFQWLWSNDDSDSGHFRRYSKNKIVKILNVNNFEIIYATYFFSFLTIPLLFIRTLPSKLGMRKESKIQAQKEHQRKGIIGKLLDFSSKLELVQINKGKSIPFGTSCLIVAKKK